MEGRRARRRSRADLESTATDSEDSLPPQEVLAPHKRRVQDPGMDPPHRHGRATSHASFDATNNPEVAGRRPYT